ncbi:MAG: adenylosuccinate lyase [Candidatus Omnitrophica bacterium]|nr:adenylosuccinate lyase [Candidatus Omnitrophota bacterium]
MIERYTMPEMAQIWTEENRFKKMLKIEILACEAMGKIGIIPKKDLINIQKKAKISIKRIQEIELKTNHDVVAFIWNISENVGPSAKYVHYGLTSSDVLDTGLSIQMKEAMDLIIASAKELQKTIKKQAIKHKKTIMIGRSHGVHAEPISFGMKMAVWYDEMTRNIERLQQAEEVISYGKISGSVGSYANVDPSVEKYVCKKVGLKPAKASSQILQRDRHAQYLNAIALLGASLEKFSTEIRGLQRTETAEVQEYFSPTQKGSSSMPHKKNPIMCERICGIARILRANAMASMENIALWHERDISHSSVERVIVPDSTILIHYALRKMIGIMNRLEVNRENMLRNLKISNGVIFSQHLMLKMIEKGLTRIEAYNIVQTAALKMYAEKKDFLEAVCEDKKVRKYMSVEEIKACGNLNYHIKQADTILKQTGILANKKNK